MGDEIGWLEATYNVHLVVSGPLERFAANEHVRRVAIILAVGIGRFAMTTPALWSKADPV